MSAPRVLTIAGVDPCGGAGLGADARTIHACGGAPATVPTATTVQNRFGFVRATPVAVAELRAMLDAVTADGPIGAVKVGLCASPETVGAIADWYASLGAAAAPMVVDPVLSATAGGGPAAARAVARAIVERLGPHLAVCTPNLPELDALGGLDALRGAGVAAVLVTGGHADGSEVVDRLFTRGGVREIRHARVAVGPVHGTGCALSAALATFVARGRTLGDACEAAAAHVHARLLATSHAGAGGDGRPVPLGFG